MKALPIANFQLSIEKTRAVPNRQLAIDNRQ